MPPPVPPVSCIRLGFVSSGKQGSKQVQRRCKRPGEPRRRRRTSVSNFSNPRPWSDHKHSLVCMSTTTTQKTYFGCRARAAAGASLPCSLPSFSVSARGLLVVSSAPSLLAGALLVPSALLLAVATRLRAAGWPSLPERSRRCISRTRRGRSAPSPFVPAWVAFSADSGAVGSDVADAIADVASEIRRERRSLTCVSADLM